MGFNIQIIKKMKTTLRKDLWLITIVAIPFSYLFIIWNGLPDKVPVHWNLEGEIDRYGSKGMLWMIPIMLPLLTYAIFLLVAQFDSNGQLSKMGFKYERLKFLLVLLMSALASYILFATKEQTMALPSVLPGLIGLLFAVLGNYFPVLKQNRYIGVKTPWTLKSELVWNKTHKMASKYWFVGGIIIFVSSLFLNHSATITLLLVVTAVISIVPMAFSYFEYQKVSKSNGL
jgi:uncharacterized membrane protein